MLRSAARALAEIPLATPDERLYRLSTSSSVIERCRTILGEAEHVVLVDAFPAPLALLASDIAAAASRGVRVAVLAYSPAQIPGAEVVVHFDAAGVLARWTGDWLNLAARPSSPATVYPHPTSR